MAHASEGRKVGHPPKSPCSLKDVGSGAPAAGEVGKAPDGLVDIPTLPGQYPDDLPHARTANQRGNAMRNEGLTFASLARTKVALYSGWG